MELAATREALEEEGQEKAQALQGQLDGVKGELARAQVGWLATACVSFIVVWCGVKCRLGFD